LPHRARELASLRLLPKLDRVAIRTSELRYLTPPRPGSLGGQAQPLGSDVAQNPENCAAEIPQRLANPRGCRAHFCRPDMAHRDGTAWLGRRDSNLCILDCNSPKTPSQGVRIRISASWNRDLSLGPGPGAPAALSKNVAGVRPTTQPVGPR